MSGWIGTLATPSIMLSAGISDAVTDERPTVLLIAGATFLAVILIAVLMVLVSRKHGAGLSTGGDDWSIAINSVSAQSDDPTKQVDTLVPVDGSASIQMEPALLSCPEGIVIGSDPELCHIRIQDPSVSPRHLRCRSIRGDLWIEDLLSANGTRIDGRVVEPFMPQTAALGQELQIGDRIYSLSPSSAGRSPDHPPVAARR